MIDTIDKAIANLHVQIGLLTELKKLYLIADLLGLPPKSIKDKVQTRVTEIGSDHVHNRRPWLKSTYSIRVGDDGWEDFAMTDVPVLLWPPKWQALHATRP